MTRPLRAARGGLLTRITLLCGLLAGAVAHAETLYVSDRLTLNLRDAPSSTGGVLRPSLSSGDALEVLRRDDDSAFLEVVTEDGRQGWVHGQYLVAVPIARDRLQAAQDRIAELEGTIAAQRAELEALADGQPFGQPFGEPFGGLSDGSAHEALEAQIDGLGQRIEELKGLLAANDGRQAEPPSRVMRTMRDYWPVLGIGFFILGLAIGLILKSRPKRSAWS